MTCCSITVDVASMADAVLNIFGIFFPRLHALMNCQRHFVNSQNRIKCNWILSEWDLRFIIVIIESAKIQSLHVRHLRDFVHATQSHVLQCPHHI